jgi:pimeloyl-ACP methyl ester carboxylesterase
VRPLKRILLGLLVLVVLAVLGFVAWAEMPLRPSPEAISALQSDSTVTVTQDRFISFIPASQRPVPTGFIFYPGGRIDARAYARPLHAIAAQGYPVFLVPVRLNLAFFDINAAAAVIAADPEITHWVIGGHSLGGVAAASFAASHPEINGLVFWASYPADDSLKSSGLPVLSIYGTEDMAGVAKFDESRVLLPADTRFVIIEGGNHAQFGDYGPQPGDNPATISSTDQQDQVVKAVVAFLASFTK